MILTFIDCFDGEFARVSGKTSEFGAKLDFYTDCVRSLFFLYLILKLFINKNQALLLSIIIHIIYLNNHKYNKKLNSFEIFTNDYFVLIRILILILILIIYCNKKYVNKL